MGKFNSLVCPAQSLGLMVSGSCCEWNHSSLKAAGRAHVFTKCYEDANANDNSNKINCFQMEKKHPSKINMLTMLIDTGSIQNTISKRVIINGSNSSE